MFHQTVAETSTITMSYGLLRDGGIVLWKQDRIHKNFAEVSASAKRTRESGTPNSEGILTRDKCWCEISGAK